MSPDPQRLTAVVGASRGIGRHLVLRAAVRGDAVLACARDHVALAELQAEHPESIEMLAGDFLGAGAELGPLADRLSDHSGPVSLIITAATIGPVGPITEVDIDEWARALQLNVAGPARILAATRPLLSTADLVVLFSGGGVGGPNPQPNVSSYTTSKAAIMHLLEVLARETPDGPTMVAIAPGSFPTGFTDPVMAADPAVAGADLLADVGRTRSAAFDSDDLDQLLDYLEAQDVSWLSGRCLSARRDTPSTLQERTPEQRNGPDLMRLRRVDGTGVVVRAW